jgi:2-polyprenyl-6-methoxyphenol hydroxylase-like FAD-dependent oxidoreductase
MSDRGESARQKDSPTPNRHAVVIGGGIGGLLAAHALARRFAQVTVLERSHYPDPVSGTVPSVRRGVPQSQCLHLLMGAGVRAFDALAPNWRQAAVARGAVPFDACGDVAMRFPSGWLHRMPSDIEMYACSRSLLEDVLRCEFDAHSNVKIVQGRQVIALLSGGADKQVTGVRIADAQNGADTLRADLVVDASGAASRLRRWIGDLSGGADMSVSETVVETGRKYVSRWFHLDPALAPDWHCLAVSPTAQAGHRAAMMLRAENNYSGVVLLAAKDDPLPENDRAFLDFTTHLDDVQLSDALVHAKPASAIHHYGRTASRIRHYDKLPQWPNGLVALADSVCALDPYYGLGMTAAARGALHLGAFIDRVGDGILCGLEFQKELAKINDQPWQIATGHDQSGHRLRYDKDRLSRMYALAPSDPEIALAVLKTQHLLLPMDALMERQFA